MTRYANSNQILSRIAIYQVLRIAAPNNQLFEQ